MRLSLLTLSVWLMLGAPKMLLAQTVDCSNGFIDKEVVDEIYDETAVNCLINETLVRGNVTIRNALNVVVRKTTVDGNILIADSETVMLYENQVIGGNISVLRPELSYVFDNILIRTDNELYIAVKGTLPRGEGLIVENLLGEGTINCATDEGAIDDKVFESDNLATTLRCPAFEFD